MPFGRFLSLICGGSKSQANRMSKTEQDEVSLAEQKLADVVEVYGSVSTTLRSLIARIDEGDPSVPKKVSAQLMLLQELFVKIKKSEEALHEKFGKGGRSDDLDLDAIRDTLRGRLDRLRAARNSG